MKKQIRVSKNFIQGELIKNPIDIVHLAQLKKSVALQLGGKWFIKAAAVIANWQINTVAKFHIYKTIYSPVKNEDFSKAVRKNK